ncbi:DUF4307 domain-containing protein [Prauserella cavernicola]|uniref:DUF4307 domain-containing protein n=1 Tax=Prauserella cavernicola TaxID=2800127 RepID=A0A934QSP8_9PSEU|nr:DUF4307 domain-containing protein [Prauserella cavernicola]MBK1785627.1 DUF4307 domain-containing protein [Prauserella cavernicola]
MSSGQATSGAGTDRPSLPEGRYGSARPQRREPRAWHKWVLVVFVLVMGGVIAYVGYNNIGSAPIEAQRVGFDERPGNAMEVTIDVTRDDPQRPAVCIVRVRDISGAESGRKEIYVPGGEERLSTVVRSIGKPVTADMYGCSYNVPEYLSSP